MDDMTPNHLGTSITKLKRTQALVWIRGNLLEWGHHFMALAQVDQRCAGIRHEERRTSHDRWPHAWAGT